VSQLQRDLQDSIEREADLREQFKFAEEEVIYIYEVFDIIIYKPFFFPKGPIVTKEGDSGGRGERIFGDAAKENGNEKRYPLSYTRFRRCSLFNLY